MNFQDRLLVNDLNRDQKEEIKDLVTLAYAFGAVETKLIQIREQLDRMIKQGINDPDELVPVEYAILEVEDPAKLADVEELIDSVLENLKKKGEKAIHGIHEGFC